MTNINLDLDALAEDVRKIKFNGKTYTVGDMPVNVILHYEKLSKMNDFEPNEAIEVVYKLLSAKNDITREEIEKMEEKQLLAILDWIAGEGIKKNYEAKKTQIGKVQTSE